jgi:hypothetical protein
MEPWRVKMWVGGLCELGATLEEVVSGCCGSREPERGSDLSVDAVKMGPRWGWSESVERRGSGSP